MKISETDLQLAADAGLINAEQVSPLWQFLRESKPDQPRFELGHVIYYFGGLLVLASMSFFMTLAWKDPALLLGTSLAFAVAYLATGRYLWITKSLTIPGGLLITAAVGLVPVVVYALQKLLGVWPQGDPGHYREYHVWVKGSWIIMEAATVVAAMAALRVFRFPFLTFPLAFSLWYMSMDLTPLLFGADQFSWTHRAWVSLVFGVIMVSITYLLDLCNRAVDLTFWLYLFGAVAFWGGMTAIPSHSEWLRVVYCLINLGMIGLAVFLRRKIFLVLGAFGVFGYLLDLSHRVFADSMLFPVALSAIGLAILFLGIQYQRHHVAIIAKVESWMPSFLREWRPVDRSSR